MMTHPDGVPYLDHVRRLKADPIAARVKHVDLRHNSDLSRLDTVDAAALERVAKYRRAMQILTEDA